MNVPVWLVIVLCVFASVAALQALIAVVVIAAHRRREVAEAPAPPPAGGECVCGKEVHGEDWHLVVVLSADDEALGIDGQTAMSADFCGEHCPGGCGLGCVPSEA